MSPAKTSLEIAALRNAALEDLNDTSDAELRQEALEENEDVAHIADRVRTTLREAAAATLRARLVQAKNSTRPAEPLARSALSGLSLARVQELIQQAFARDPALGLAFRQGVRQSEADWRSLYEDLIALGAIKPNDCGD
jgi:hypothetical protein